MSAADNGIDWAQVNSNQSNRHSLRSAVEQIEVHEFEANALAFPPDEPVLTIEVLGVDSGICRAEELSLSLLIAIYGITAGLMRCWRSRYERTYRCESKSIHQNDAFECLSALRCRSLHSYGLIVSDISNTF